MKHFARKQAKMISVSSNEITVIEKLSITNEIMHMKQLNNEIDI